MKPQVLKDKNPQPQRVEPPTRKTITAELDRVDSIIDKNFGRKLRGFLIGGKIGQGGRSTVYEAKHEKTNEKVAIKLYKVDDENEAKAMLAEAERIKKIDHPNIVSIKDAGVEKTNDAGEERLEVFVVMELLSGKDLGEFLGEEQVVPALGALKIAFQVCEGLEELHKKGIIHRDLKPGNIFLQDEGVVKIIDFDISEVTLFEAEDELRYTKGQFRGTPEYMGPDAWGDDSDSRVDLYALGVVMYEMLCGMPPFEGNGLLVAKSHLEMPPLKPSEKNEDVSIPAEVEAIVMKALEKDPDKRFQSPAEMKAALQLILGPKSPEMC
jgi:serine/threonine-protein kinase